MEKNLKRKPDNDHNGPGAKRSKPWRMPRKGTSKPTIDPGDAGIWATCEMGKEGKCTSELRDLFDEYASKMYGETSENVEEPSDSDNAAEIDIEAEINKEVQGLKSKSTKKQALFQTVKMDIQCVLFFKTRPPIEPVGFVHRICKDASEGATQKHRWVKKLTPMTTMGRATAEGLETVAMSVLQPVFHSDEATPKKFAIRPTRRNHNDLKRDEIIKQVARSVGRKHSVDLKNYDHLILVEVYRNVLGMSVVGGDFEEMKQYNLAEIYNPTPKPDADKSHSMPEPKKGKEDAPNKPNNEEGNAIPIFDDKTHNDATPCSVNVQGDNDSPDNTIPNHPASQENEAPLTMMD